MSFLPKKRHGSDLKCGGPQMCSDCREEQEEQQAYGKIREMGKLTVLSNRISEVQEKNLKVYPLIFFNGITSAKVEYDVSSKKTVDDEPAMSNSLITYHLTVDPAAENPAMERRFQAIEQAVRQLFWSDLIVEVYINDKIAFKSKK